MKKLWWLLLAAAGALVAEPADRASCENLSKLTLPHTTITRAQIYPAGPLAPSPDNGSRRQRTLK